MKNKKKTTIWWVWVLIGFGVIVIFSLINNSNVFIYGPRVGIVEINTPIMSSREIVRELNYFLKNDKIDAVVIHLETPGGSVAASQEIYSKVKSMSENGKPVYASMGNVAASGGYYIALGADTIIANPGTATGSIGVIMGYPVLNELMDKVGINYTAIKSGEYKDSGSSYRETNKDDTEYFQNLVNNLYEQFVLVVSEERKLSYKTVKTIADGKVYSGEQAYELGLIDLLGTLEDAIYLAGRASGSINTPIVVKPPEQKKKIWDAIFGEIRERTTMSWLYPKPEYRLIY